MLAVQHDDHRHAHLFGGVAVEPGRWNDHQAIGIHRLRPETEGVGLGMPATGTTRAKAKQARPCPERRIEHPSGAGPPGIFLPRMLKQAYSRSCSRS